jgi:hypothetical protein
MICAFVEDACGIGSVCKAEHQDSGNQSSRSTRRERKLRCHKVYVPDEINIYTK